MGALLCKGKNESPDVLQINDVQVIAELRSYEAACKSDHDLRSFDANLQARTNRVINTVASIGADIRSLSFNSLKEITDGLLEINEELVKVILDSKKDIWNSPELSELVEEYFTGSFHMVDFCTALEKCLNKTSNRHLIMRFALQHFEEEDSTAHTNDSEKYLRTLEELKKFKNTEDPFTDEFFQIFQKVHEQQYTMLRKLLLHKRKIKKNLQFVKARRKISSVIFITAFVTALICTVVATAIAAPPIAAALTGAASVSVGPVGKWFDSLWQRSQVALEQQGQLISSMQLRTTVVISELGNIRVLVDKLEIQIESLVQNVDFALKGEDKLKFGIEEIKKKMETFMPSVEALQQHVCKCNEYITNGRTVILEKIMKDPK